MPKARGFTHDNKDNTTVDWWTPEWIFKDLGLTFDLDVAAPVGGVPWIPAAKHYTEEQNGLAQEWKGKVWCNPPYGDKTGLWMERMAQHKNGVALVFARTDCKWFQEYVTTADALLFIRGRLSFVDATKATKGGGAGAGSLLAAWGFESVMGLIKMQDKGFFVMNKREDTAP